MKKNLWRMVPFLIFMVLALFFWRGLSLDPHEVPSAQVGKALPAFKLPTLESDKIFTPAVLRGHVVLLNVWASWCAACTEEQIFLMELAQKGVVIYGLDYKDHPNDAKAWLEEWGNPYRSIGSDRDGKVSIDLGVYGAPETFLIDKTGVIRYRHVGVLTKEIWAREFLMRIKHWEAQA